MQRTQYDNKTQFSFFQNKNDLENKPLYLSFYDIFIILYHVVFLLSLIVPVASPSWTMIASISEKQRFVAAAFLSLRWRPVGLGFLSRLTAICVAREMKPPRGHRATPMAKEWNESVRTGIAPRGFGLSSDFQGLAGASRRTPRHPSIWAWLDWT